MKVHWLHSRWSDSRLHAACGLVTADSPNTTENPDDVTCLNCQKVIEDDMRTIDEEAEDRAWRRAKQTGRGRAVSELVDRYRDEFEVLWKKHTAEVFDEIWGEERRQLEARRRRAQEQVERRRTELLAELERLGPPREDRKGERDG